LIHPLKRKYSDCWSHHYWKTNFDDAYRIIICIKILLQKNINIIDVQYNDIVMVVVFNTTFNNISDMSWQSVFNGGGNRSTWRKLLTCHKSVTNYITYYYIMIFFKQFYWRACCHLTFRKIWYCLIKTRIDLVSLSISNEIYQTNLFHFNVIKQLQSFVSFLRSIKTRIDLNKRL
jgi:hypothetical protein